MGQIACYPVSQERIIRRAAAASRSSGERLDGDGGAVCANLDAGSREVGRLESEGHDRVGALSLGLLAQSGERFLAAVVQELGDAFEFTTGQRLEAGSDVGADVAGPDREAEGLAVRMGDAGAGDVVSRDDEHARERSCRGVEASVNLRRHVAANKRMSKGAACGRSV